MTELGFTLSPGSYIAPLFSWLNTNFHGFFAAVSTGVESVLAAVLWVLTLLPAWGLIAVVAALAFVLADWRVALLAVGTLGFCWAMNLWAASLQTIALVLVSVTASVAIAFPLGVLAARRPKVEAAFRPVLDVMQTVPPWIYLIPAMMIFSLGRVPALIATVVYGVPPMLRLTTLALKQVPKNFQELGDALGAPRSTVLWMIELPLAKPTLLVGLNQCILLSLAIVVLAGLVGAGGLGAEVTRGLMRMEIGIGLRAGLSIVAVALLLDRLSRAALDRAPRRGLA
ncbi:proline/glycine betaine ABC transporter permease [uncultured Aureimonas sp.]|uniref:ABC transporter permease n=1 Tax=uncultured Aureimonas sp. TaxID=1604662 RepID=UPI0025FBEEFB|nr:ABC transporter permease subunit [uncultured Aureimonas sp.]